MLKLNKDDYKNLQTLLDRVSYQGRAEANLCIILNAKLQNVIDSLEEPIGNSNSTGADKSGSDQSTGD